MTTILDFIVLGMINEQPRYAGEIYNIIRERKIHHILNFTPSSIYPKVNNLEHKGYIAGKNEQYLNRNVEVRRYTITKTGKDAFEESINEQIYKKLDIYSDFKETIFLLDYIDRKQRMDFFERVKNIVLEEKSKIHNIYIDKDIICYSDRVNFGIKEEQLIALENWISDC